MSTMNKKKYKTGPKCKSCDNKATTLNRLCQDCEERMIDEYLAFLMSPEGCDQDILLSNMNGFGNE